MADNIVPKDASIIVFADGAAKGNPGPGGWGVIVAIAGGQAIELGGSAGYTTNNKMEMTAPIEALRCVRDEPGVVRIYSDSTYVIKGITSWVWNWRRRGWKTATGGDVLNRDLWEELVDLVSRRGKGNIQWNHVRGHSGIPGNERVDEIASAFAMGEVIDLFRGPLSDYTVDLSAGVAPAGEPPPRSGGRTEGASKAPAYSYLSVVGGEPRRHCTWAECEQRVKGISGARFKKSTSAADEQLILRGWGVDPSRLR